MIMNEQTFYLLKIWLENAPESCHPYDMERFYQFVYALLEYDDGILNSDDFFRIIKETHPKRSQKYMEEFFDFWESKINAIVGFCHYNSAK